MRILLNSLYYHPDPAANSVIMTQLARELSAAGHAITVVCAFPHYDTNRIWPDYRGKMVQESVGRSVTNIEPHAGIGLCYMHY